MKFVYNPLTGELDSVSDFSTDTLHVLRAGDTMTGTLTTSGALVATGSYIPAPSIAGVYIGIPSGLNPRFTIVPSSGSVRAIDNGSGTIRMINSTAGTVQFMGTDAGLFTLGSGSTPTHTLTLPSTSTGIALYNTSDQTTNYERVRQYWNSNTFTITTENGGTGTARDVLIGTPASNIQIRSLQYSTGTFALNRGISQANAVHTALYGSFTASSGTNAMLDLTPPINQSGTAGYTVLRVNPTETTTGSGTKLLADFQVGGVSKVSIDNSGNVNVASIRNGSAFTNSRILMQTVGTQIDRNVSDANATVIIDNKHASSTGDILQMKNSGGVVAKVNQKGVFFPVQAVTASAPTYVKGGMYFDTTLNKLRIGGASGWESITSV